MHKKQRNTKAPASSQDKTSEYGQQAERSTAPCGQFLPESYIRQHIVSFPPLAEDEISEQELSLRWGLSLEEIRLLISQGKLLAEEQSAPLRQSVFAPLLPYRFREVMLGDHLRGGCSTVYRYVIKISEAERYARVQRLTPLKPAAHHSTATVAFHEAPSGCISAATAPIVRPEPDARTDTRTLKATLAEYEQTKVAEGAWQVSSLPDHHNRLGYLLEIMGDNPIKSIARTDMRQLRDTIKKLPPNRTRSPQYRGKSISELAAMQHEKTLNVKTINTIMEAIASFFEWCVREDYLDKNPTKGLQFKDTRDQKTLRDAFTHEDIQKIFLSEAYQCLKSKKPQFFWPPLIGLYTGMRLEEICQLHCADVFCDEKSGIWAVNICTSADDALENQKHIKTGNAQRIIPVHNALVDAGLLDYLQSIKESGHVRLFPQLNRTVKTPKYGKQVGKAFTALLKDLHIAGNKTFHSLRHTFSHYFHERDLHNDVFRQIFGHEIKELAGRQYGTKFDVQKCYGEIISKIKFNVYIKDTIASSK